MTGLPDRAGTDDLPLGFQPGNNPALQPHPGHGLGHDFVVQLGCAAGGLFPHIPALNAQGSGNLPEHRQIQCRLGSHHILLIFQEIAGEGGAADDVSVGVVADYVGQIGHSFHNQLLADPEGNWACLLAENKQMQHIVFLGGLLHQMPVAQGEGIGIHHHSGNPIPFPAGFGQPGAVVGKAAATVFHEHQLFRNPGNFIKAKI